MRACVNIKVSTCVDRAPLGGPAVSRKALFVVHLSRHCSLASLFEMREHSRSGHISLGKLRPVSRGRERERERGEREREREREREEGTEPSTINQIMGGHCQRASSLVCIRREEN